MSAITTKMKFLATLLLLLVTPCVHAIEHDRGFSAQPQGEPYHYGKITVVSSMDGVTGVVTGYSTSSGSPSTYSTYQNTTSMAVQPTGDAHTPPVPGHAHSHYVNDTTATSVGAVTGTGRCYSGHGTGTAGPVFSTGQVHSHPSHHPAHHHHHHHHYHHAHRPPHHFTHHPPHHSPHHPAEHPSSIHHTTLETRLPTLRTPVPLIPGKSRSYHGNSSTDLPTGTCVTGSGYTNAVTHTRMYTLPTTPISPDRASDATPTLWETIVFPERDVQRLATWTSSSCDNSKLMDCGSASNTPTSTTATDSMTLSFIGSTTFSTSCNATASSTTSSTTSSATAPPSGGTLTCANPLCLTFCRCENGAAVCDQDPALCPSWECSCS